MNEKKLLSVMRKGIEKYNLIKEGDKIAVGVSGGKDSLALLKLLSEFKKFSPKRFDLIAISVDLRFNGIDSDYSKISEMCKNINVPFFIEKTDIGQIIFDVRKEKNPCALCSKMRKGALYEKAKAEGCNKVALGHHSDDLTDTFVLSLFYEGRLSTFAPKSYLDRTKITLIRPLILAEEIDILPYAKSLPVLESRCPANKNTQREYVKNILSLVGKTIPNVKEMVFSALTHPERYNLFDKFEKEIDIL